MCLNWHQGQGTLQPVAAALEMGPRERAMYLKQPRRAPAAAQYEEAADATLAGPSAGALRSWLRQVSAPVPAAGRRAMRGLHKCPVLFIGNELS